MESSSPHENMSYFGFRDVPGYKDFVVYVYVHAPDAFPKEDWETLNTQMNLERAFVGLRWGLTLLPTFAEQAQALIEDAWTAYHAGDDGTGQSKLEELETLLRKVGRR